MLVLAGGRAERMGGRKAELPWRDGTLLAHVVGVARAVSDDVLVASGARDLRTSVPSPDTLGWVSDDPSVGGEGPLGGVLAGLAAMRAEWLWLLACDMPFIAPQALGPVARAAASSEALALVHAGRRGAEPLGALLHRDAGPRASAYAEGGGRSLRGLLEVLGAAVVADPPMTSGIPALPMLHNVNTPAELAEARRRDGAAPPAPSRRTPSR